MAEYDNYDITIEECEYEGCNKQIAVCACCEDKNNLKYHMICDTCRRLYCIGHKYYTFCTCPQDQTWYTVCRDCIPTKFPNTIIYEHVKFDDYHFDDYENGNETRICPNYSVCGQLVVIDIISNARRLCSKCSHKE